nr:rust resistance kinase Lr10-like [Quercus suber]
MALCIKGSFSRLVAIKMLDKSKANGQDFISEVATIGRIHLMNVVQLIGFCAKRPKRALIYEFMPNANKRKNFDALADHSSQIYFPTWFYDQVSKGNDIVMEDATEHEKKTINKMIIVALWCIQMKPSDCCSMNKVVEMLVGEVECLQMPSKSFLSSLVDVGDSLNPTCSSIQSELRLLVLEFFFMVSEQAIVAAT